MDLATEVIAALRTGLEVWLHKDKTKFLDQLISIEKRLYEARNLPEDEQDHRTIDNLLFELRLVRIGFSATVAGQTAPDKP